MTGMARTTSPESQDELCHFAYDEFELLGLTDHLIFEMIFRFPERRLIAATSGGLRHNYKVWQ
jgi:hypothetical protein